MNNPETMYLRWMNERDRAISRGDFAYATKCFDEAMICSVSIEEFWGPAIAIVEVLL